MRSRLIAALFPLLALSATAPAEQASDPLSLQPGQWEMATQMTSVEAPGAPEELLQQLRASLADQRQVQSQCITPEQARDPVRTMVGRQTPARCEFSETVWSGGIIRIRANCRPPEGSATQLFVDGTYAARRIDNRLDMTLEIPNPTGVGAALELRLQGRMTGRRTGECAAPDSRANENSLAPAN